MARFTKIKSGFAAVAITAAMCTSALVALPSPAAAQSTNRDVILSIGEVHQINLTSPVTDVVIADPRVADVEVTSAKRVYILAKGVGATDILATDASGRTVYRGKVLVGGNLSSLNQMFKIAMPDADIQVTAMNNVVLLTGTVAQPEDAAEAERLALTFTASKGEGNSEGTNVINRIKTATPLQINLQVRIAEVSRSLSKEISGNLQTKKNGFDSNGNPYFVGAAQGRDVTTGNLVNYQAGGSTIAAIGRLFGIDVEAAFDMSEKAGLVSTLANPNLTTVSGETAEFLAGGQFPVVTASANGTNVEYKNYGVNLTYTPVVLSDGRISLRVRSEVSDISSQGAVRINGAEIPATTSRMAETTVELGSGQSMMIAGLLSNQMGSSISKTPGAGDIPILGALFKSNGWRRNETELMIVITPYLVKPVSESQLVLPTDGLHTPNDLERVLLGKMTNNQGDKARPMPSIAPTVSNGPGMSSVNQSAPQLSAKPQLQASASAASGPGFSFDN
ncbi:type II and III secretion system protein family protein [Sphingorhabdus sp.]|uniref:type II and III secretion system protein family protein n=1 Tax=Sphingorhabdus sp. TaxID=1902408 RepID=UPI00391C3135